jgi:hypothetical protein
MPPVTVVRPVTPRVPATAVLPEEAATVNLLVLMVMSAADVPVSGACEVQADIPSGPDFDGGRGAEAVRSADVDGVDVILRIPGVVFELVAR